MKPTVTLTLEEFDKLRLAAANYERIKPILEPLQIEAEYESFTGKLQKEYVKGVSYAEREQILVKLRRCITDYLKL